MNKILEYTGAIRTTLENSPLDKKDYDNIDDWLAEIERTAYDNAVRGIL